MEGETLHPKVNDKGVHLFEESEVDSVAAEVQKTGRALPEHSAEEIEAHEHEVRHLKEMLDATEFQIETLKRQLEQERIKVRTQTYRDGAEMSRKRQLLRELENGVSTLIGRIEAPDHYTVMVATRVDQCIRDLSR